MAQYVVQEATIDNWTLFRDIRLEALRLEPQAFGSNFAKESAYTETEWKQKWIGDGKTSASFLLLFGDNVIGLTGIMQQRENPDHAVLVASYIRREHRGMGLSKLLYEARINWARDTGYKAIIVSHRESNQASKHANQKFGFDYTHRERKTWPDGIEEDNVFYKLSL